jgi:hypothetical protein
VFLTRQSGLRCQVLLPTPRFQGGRGASFLYLASGRPCFSPQTPFGNASLCFWFFSGEQCSKLCISVDLKTYQSIKVEWIGSFAQPDIGNLPPCLPEPIGLFTGQDLPNLPPCLPQFTIPASQNPQELAVDIPTLLCQYRAMLGETQNQFSLTRAAPCTSGRSKSKCLSVQFQTLMKMLNAIKLMTHLLTRFTLGGKSTRSNRLALIAAGLAICGHALAQTPLEFYDSSIAADALLPVPLTPVATLTTPVVLTGTSGSAFDFGATSGEVTMEFILKGDPAFSTSSFLAVGTNNPKSRLMYEVWPSTLQLGFTEGGVADYLFTPGVASPTNDTHLAFVWNSTNLVMKVYVNGTLAGTASGVDAAFAMPTGWGWLGASDQGGSDGMRGTIYRVTVYGEMLSEQAIRRHSSAFGASVGPALAAYDTVITNDAASGLTPIAELTSSLVLNGSGGASFDFGAGGADGTMEFILEGDPSPTSDGSAFLAMGQVTTSSLRYNAWDNTGQLGFTQNHVADYLFSPGVPSPSLPTHITYAWNSATLTMKMYVNGVLAGTTTGVNSAFVMPSGLGLLGDDGGGAELMLGTIYRVTAYDSVLTDAAILRHGKAFGDLLSPPTILSFTVTPAAITAGQSATLSWTTKDALKVLVNGIDRTGITNLTVSPQISTRYTLTAQNALGATSSTIALQVNPNLSAYDAAIAADAAGGLAPLARLTNAVQTDGTGVPFNFGTNSGDATMEIILEGEPNPGTGTSIATDYDEATGLWRNSLRYSQWPTPGQIGFSLRGVNDYTFTPLVPSPNWPTHLTFVWDATAFVVKVYVNGSLAGENSAADPGCGLPTGQGTIGGDGMLGSIFRITSYSGKVPETKILSHSKAFLGAARPALNAYDNAIENSSAGGLNPAARLFAPVILTGAGGVNFFFGENSGDATMEFILEGDPTASVSAFLAVGATNTDSRLTYQAWPSTGQLGFTEGGVADYVLTPGVPSPTNATHITFAWSATTTTMKVYVNGILAGTRTGVSPLFALPSDVGVLGDSIPSGEPMVGTIHRVTAYDGLLPESAIVSHGMAFAGQPPAIALSTKDGVATIALSQGIPGAHYRVEYRNSLGAADNWQLLQDIPALVGTTAGVPDPTPIANHTSRLYHAVLVR